MKTIYILVTVLLLTNKMFAQDTTSCFNNPNTGFVSDDIDFSGHGSVFTLMSRIKNENIAYLGGGGTVIIDKKYLFGAFGTGLLSNKIINDGTYKGNTLEVSYMGLWLGYIFLSEKRIHPIISSQFAIGGLSLTSNKMPIRDFYDDITVINPIIEAEIRINKYLRFSIGGQYSMFFGVSNLENYSNESFDNMGAYISLKIGW